MFESIYNIYNMPVVSENYWPAKKRYYKNGPPASIWIATTNSALVLGRRRHTLKFFGF